MHNGCLFVLIVHKQSLNVNSPLPSVPLLLSPAFLTVLNCNEVLMILNRTPPPCFAPCTPLNVSVNYCGPCVRHKNYNNNNNNVNITPLGDHWNTAKGCFEPLSSCFTEIHHREWAAQSDTWENQADSSFFLWMLISKFLTILNNEVYLKVISVSLKLRLQTALNTQFQNVLPLCDVTDKWKVFKVFLDTQLWSWAQKTYPLAVQTLFVRDSHSEEIWLQWRVKGAETVCFGED